MSLEPFERDSPCSLAIELEFTAEKTLGAKPAHQQVGIGHRRLGSASIADRARIRARRFGPYPQRAAGIEASERSAARAHCVNLQHGNAHRKPGYLRLAPGSNRALDRC